MPSCVTVTLHAVGPHMTDSYLQARQVLFTSL